MAAFHLLQMFSGWRFLLPLTLYSCLLLFVGQLPKLLCLRSFTREMLPHPTQRWFFPHHFPHSSPIRLRFHNLPPLHICQWFFSFCLQLFVETLLTQVGRVCFIAFIYRRELPLRVFSLHCLSQRNKGFSGTLALRRSSLPLLHAPYSFLLFHNPVFSRIPPESLFFLDS